MSDPEKVVGKRIPLAAFAPFVGRWVLMMEYHPERDPEQQDGVVGYVNGFGVFNTTPDELKVWFESPIGKVTYHHANNISIELARP